MNTKNVIVFRNRDFSALIESLHADKSREAMAIGYYRLSTTERTQRLLVQALSLPADADYETRTPTLVGLGGEFLQDSLDRCEGEKLHLLDIHTHPWQSGVEFSGIDDHEATAKKGPYLKKYLPNICVTYLLFGSSPYDIRARMWDNQQETFVEVDIAIVW